MVAPFDDKEAIRQFSQTTRGPISQTGDLSGRTAKPGLGKKMVALFRKVMGFPQATNEKEMTVFGGSGIFYAKTFDAAIVDIAKKTLDACGLPPKQRKRALEDLFIEFIFQIQLSKSKTNQHRLQRVHTEANLLALSGVVQMAAAFAGAVNEKMNNITVDILTGLLRDYAFELLFRHIQEASEALPKSNGQTVAEAVREVADTQKNPATPAKGTSSEIELHEME